MTIDPLPVHVKKEFLEVEVKEKVLKKPIKLKLNTWFAHPDFIIPPMKSNDEENEENSI